MTRTPLTLDPDDNVGLAAEIMGWAHVRHLPVMKAHGVVGIVSEHDILVSLTELGALTGRRRPVREIMTRPIQAITPDAEAREAAARMAGKGIHCLPVVANGRLVGVVTATDLLAHHALEPAASERPEPPASDAAPIPTDVLVRNIARPSPEVARPDELVLDAAARMAERDIRHLPIVDQEQRVIGILSDGDVRQAIGSPYRLVVDAVLPEAIATLAVGAIMSPQPVTIRGDARLFDVAHLFAQRRIGAAPVVDNDDHLVGIVSYVDVLRAFASAARPR